MLKDLMKNAKINVYLIIPKNKNVKYEEIFFFTETRFCGTKVLKIEWLALIWKAADDLSLTFPSTDIKESKTIWPKSHIYQPIIIEKEISNFTSAWSSLSLI